MYMYVCMYVVLFLILVILLFTQHVNKHKLNYYYYSYYWCVARMRENTNEDKMLIRKSKYQTRFFLGVSTRFRVLASTYGASRSHSLDTLHSVVPLWTSIPLDAETGT